MEITDLFDIWNCIKMIITDTTAVNIAKKNGVVTRLQKKFGDLGFDNPQYVSCQHHNLEF